MMTNHDIVSLLVTCQLAAPAATVALVGVPALLGRPPSERATALIVGGGAVETTAEFRRWFIDEIRAGMPSQREEQATLPIHVMPSGDSAGARGAALDAARMVRERGL